MVNIIFVLISIGCCVWALFFFRATLKRERVKEFFLSHNATLHPNVISLYGFFSTVIGFLFLLDDLPHYALLFYALASFLDGADGSAARAFGKTSDAGKLLDPLCDKFRYFLFLSYFSYYLGVLLTVPLSVFFIADLASQFSRIIISKMEWIDGSGIRANVFGKAKTVVADFLVGYCFMIFLEPWLPNVTKIIIFALIGLSVLSTAFKFFSFEDVQRFILKRVRKTGVV